MRKTRTALGVTAALLTLAATSAYAGTTATTTTPCTKRGSTAYAYFTAGATGTWDIWQHTSDGYDSQINTVAVSKGTKYKVYVTDPNYVTASLSVDDPSSTVSANGQGKCDAPAAEAGVVMPDNVTASLVPGLPIVLVDTSAIFD
jgi:hypothetical protein